ncbi:hypothetical protein LCGC14_3026090, partial [marine sediment metagenome]
TDRCSGNCNTRLLVNGSFDVILWSAWSSRTSRRCPTIEQWQKDTCGRPALPADCLRYVFTRHFLGIEERKEITPDSDQLSAEIQTTQKIFPNQISALVNLSFGEATTNRLRGSGKTHSYPSIFIWHCFS